MKGLRLYLIGSVTALILYLLAQYYKPQDTNWDASYLREDKIPFGLYILDKEIRDLFPEAHVVTSGSPVYNTLKNKNFKNTSYLFVAGRVDLDNLDYRELVRFMQSGNQVFIAAFSVGKFLSDTLHLEVSSGFQFGEKKSVSINFVNPALKTPQGYVFDRGLGEQFFSKIDSQRVTILGKNANGRINFLKYNFGKGSLYILPDPKLLTNYNLLHPEGTEYAEKALSYLPLSDTLIWDEHHTRGSGENTSVLRVIFKHDQLRWAYYLALTGLLVFVFFEMKRRQRIIPVIEPLKNSSAEFVKVVGRVYYHQRDNRDIAYKKINYFLEYIRTAYRLKTTSIDEDLLAAVIIKSGAEQDMVRALFASIKDINNTSKVNDAQLIDLNQRIEKFYKQVR